MQCSLFLSSMSVSFPILDLISILQIKSWNSSFMIPVLYVRMNQLLIKGYASTLLTFSWISRESFIAKVHCTLLLDADLSRTLALIIPHQKHHAHLNITVKIIQLCWIQSCLPYLDSHEVVKLFRYRSCFILAQNYHNLQVSHLDSVGPLSRNLTECQSEWGCKLC